jgi:hypothetical protein
MDSPTPGTPQASCKLNRPAPNKPSICNIFETLTLIKTKPVTRVIITNI